MKRIQSAFILSISLLIFACSLDNNQSNGNSNNDTLDVTEKPKNDSETTYSLLSLGDSYTIGQSVCSSCRFPSQLKDSLNSVLTKNKFDLRIVAQTGWTTTNLITKLDDENLGSNFDLVTLLIGVNNQFQGKPFEIYETEFPALVDMAIAYANNDPSKLIVISIPDYAYTPFGNGNWNITNGIDQYNGFARNYCYNNNITFVDITDITRLGLVQPELVASDGLHPSTIAYSKFVERLLPQALQKL